MQEITVRVGDLLFDFSSFGDWCDSARRKFLMSGARAAETICVDSAGRVCQKGEEFQRARDENTFPVRVYYVLCGK